MTKKLVSGNMAISLAALASGVKVICGYPGTPSTEAIDSIIKSQDKYPGTHIEWSTNEKVAIEVAATTGWAGKRALCTMKMSGVNVAYDSLAGIAHSGTIGGLVIYVADDPGVSSGMVEQDTRGFALMSDMVMLEPSSVQEMYSMTKYAFGLSEQLQAPVFVRGVTCLSQSYSIVDIDDYVMPDDTVPHVKKDITKYAKAGAVMCMTQHQDAINRLAKGNEIIHADHLHSLKLGKKGGLGVICSSVAKSYVGEAMKLAESFGAKFQDVSFFNAACTVPYPDEEIDKMLENCGTIIVLEELEPYMEREVYVRAHMTGSNAKIIGKLDGAISRIGSFNAAICAKAFCKAAGVKFDDAMLAYGADSAAKALPRPITTCAGCPHRGTYMAINQAIKNAKLKKDDIIVTGDIGCTILGMNPPFNTIWMEIAMGASIPCAHGFKFAGVDKPVFATIGDSTFIHNGMPGLVNAIQHNTDITVIIMDNGWTGMTGMQVNPNTEQQFQYGTDTQVDVFGIVKGMGIEHLWLADPYDHKGMTAILDECLKIKGLKVVVARRECAIQANRRGVKYGKISIDNEKCIRCKACIGTTGCMALKFEDNQIKIDPAFCNGCGLCTFTCPKKAIIKEEIA